MLPSANYLLMMFGEDRFDSEVLRKELLRTGDVLPDAPPWVRFRRSNEKWVSDALAMLLYIERLYEPTPGDLS